MQFRRVLDLTVVLLVEVYRERGSKFAEIMEELNSRMRNERVEKGPPVPTPQQSVANMAVLEAMMAGSDWRGR